MKFLFGGNDFIPLIISVEFNREAWRLLRNTFLDERQFFLTEIYPILNSVKKKEESKKAILNKPKL